MGHTLSVERSQPFLLQRSRSVSCSSLHRRRLLAKASHNTKHFVLFDELSKDVFVYSLRYLPSQDHCKLARTNRNFADGSRAARLLYKGLRINSLRPAPPSRGLVPRRGSVNLAHVARRAFTSVFGRSQSNSVSTAAAAGAVSVAPTTPTPGGAGPPTEGSVHLLPFLRLFRRTSGANSSTSSHSVATHQSSAGGTTRAAIRALSSGAFENLRMLSFPHDFDVHVYDLSYHELASIFNGCKSLKLVSSLPGGVLSFVTTPLPGLREISVISGTPSDLHSLFRHAPDLTWLSFSPILSSACEGLLCQIPDALPKLKTLELICIRLARHRLLNNLRKLGDLEMFSMQQVGVDDVDLRALSEGGHPSLKVLVILGNPQVSYAGLRMLHQNLKSLKVLDVRESLSHC